MKPRRAGFAVLVAAAILAASAAAEDLKEFSPDGKFTVLMPGKPTEKSQNKDGLAIKSWIARHDKGAYIATATDLPKGAVPAAEDAVNAMLDNAAKSSVAGVGGTFKSADKVVLEKKHPGRAYEADVPARKGKIKGRLYLVGERFYQVYCAGEADFVDSEEAKKFLDSFKLVEDKKESAPKK